MYHIAEEAKNIGLDMFVLDDGWFGRETMTGVHLVTGK
ncbi:MAG: alpha-galactosidase [Dorea sp.]